MRPPSPTNFNDLLTEFLLDEMCGEQYPYDYQEKENGEYCIGYAGKLQPGGDYILLNSLEPRIFYQYSLQMVQAYLERCAGISPKQIPKPVSVQIIKVIRKKGDETYYAVNKTRWLCEFQRKIRKYLQNR